MTELRLAREANGLEQIVQSVLGDPLPDLDALLANLTAETELEKEQAQGHLDSLNLTLESLARLIAIRDKDQLASSDSKKEPVQPEEWEEVYAILTQARSSYFPNGVPTNRLRVCSSARRRSGFFARSSRRCLASCPIGISTAH